MGSIKTRPVIVIITACISPFLIMLMLGSLVFFLIDVLYAGDYSFRLLYTFTFYVFAAVLIARISIQQSQAYASIYLVALVGACFLAMMTFVKYPDGAMKALGPILNLVLMGLVWWAANKLTWDCTHFDQDRKASGQGILAATGLDERSAFAVPTVPKTEEATPKKRKQPPSWMERYQSYRATQRAKPHTPGTWVLYFALAAIPLFARGQSLIDVDDGARRWSAFVEMAVYVGSALGLLSTTSLMGLHRYLDERSARISQTLTISWLGISFGLIVMFIAVAALLPRPHSETSILRFSKAGSEDRKASKNAVSKGGNAGKGEGSPGQAQKPGDGKNQGEKGKPSGKGDDPKQKGKGEQSKSGDSKEQGDQKGDQKQGDSKQESQENDSQDQQDGDQKDGDEQDGESKDGEADNESSSSPPESSQTMKTIGKIVKWIVWVVIVIAVVVGIIVFLLKGLAPFTDWARNLLNWLRGLFGAKVRTPQNNGVGDSQTVTTKPRPKPFADFSNPFRDGSYRTRDLPELVRYTFMALDAWAWDIDQGREPGETPNEFATRLSIDHVDLDSTPSDIVKLLMQCQFSQQRLPKDGLKRLQTCWRTLETTTPSVAVSQTG